MSDPHSSIIIAAHKS